MTYQLEPFKTDFRQKIINDLASQPELQRKLKNRFLEIIDNWAIDREINSYLFPIWRPGLINEIWYQFFLNGHAYEIAIPDAGYRNGIEVKLMGVGNSTKIPPEFLEKLQQAFDVHGALGYGPDSSYDSKGAERVLILSISGWSAS